MTSFTVLRHCWLGDRKDIPAHKNLCHTSPRDSWKWPLQWRWRKYDDIVIHYYSCALVAEEVTQWMKKG